MSHDHPSPAERRSAAARGASECPAREKLSQLAKELLAGRERDDIERHVAACERCALELTRLVEERQNLDRGGRRRHFPWVPVIASATVLIACGIAWLLSGGGRQIELVEPGRLLSFAGAVEVRRGKAGPVLRPEIGLALESGDQVRTPDREAQIHFLSATGVLYRYDSRGETLLARLGSRAAIPSREQLEAELGDVAADVVAVRAPERRIQPRAPRGNILSQKPVFELSGAVPEGPIPIEIREEGHRIRLRWEDVGPRIAFPSSGRSLDRGRTFFWKAAGMQEELGFFIASAREIEEWCSFRGALERFGLPAPAALILEARYLLNRGFHLDALARMEDVCRRSGDAVWPLQEAAIVLDRLGRTEEARELLARASASASRPGPEHAAAGG
ncbi:MAG: hypothetical protein JXQ29_14330 [Planctomycetes bacterium]|nr:hypothetical protein [Planctomycetota bacterium]